VAEARRLRFPPTVLPPPLSPPPPREILDGLESASVGEHPRGATVSGEEKGAPISITAEQAARGRHSLKVSDKRDLSPSWQPHFFYEPHLRQGVIRQGFDLRLEAGALMFVEWRDDTAYPHNVGSSVTFDGASWITTGGNVLTTVPTSNWVHVELEARLDAEASRAFKLKVVSPDGAARVFAESPYSGKDFTELHWAGFSSTAAADTVFYRDNLELKRVGD
jgi:hypothetical protein